MNEDNSNPQENATPGQPEQQPIAPAPFAPQQVTQPEPSPDSTPAPMQTTPQHSPATVQQSASASTSEYNSNPFIAAGKGIGFALVNNPVASILLAIVPMVILFGVALLSSILGAVAGPIGSIISGIVLIVAFVLVILRTTAGTIVVLLDSGDGHKITTKEAMGERSSKHLTTFFVSGLVSGLMILAGLIFFIIPGVILLARLSLVPILVYAEELKTMAAIKRSFALTKGHTFEMLGVITAQSIIGSNGLLSTISAYAGTSRRYVELVELEKSGAPKPKVHWLNFIIPILFVLLFAAYVGLMIVTASQGSKSNSIYQDDIYKDDSLYDSNYDSNLDNQYEFDNNYQYDYDYSN